MRINIPEIREERKKERKVSWRKRKRKRKENMKGKRNKMNTQEEKSRNFN